MAYETGGSSGVNDLLDKIRVFAAANGWTVDFNGARTDDDPEVGGTGAVAGNIVLMHKSGLFAGFATDTKTGSNSTDPGPYFQTFYFSSYSSGADPFAQSGMSGAVRTNKLVGPFQAYHLFAGDTYLHVVVEQTPGSFRHFGVGVLEKAGAVTTAAYASGMYWNWSTNEVNSFASSYHALPWDDGNVQNPSLSNVFRADSDSVSPRHCRLSDWANGGGQGWGGYRRDSNQAHENAPAAGFTRLPPSALTGRSVLFPLIIGVHRPSTMLSIVGAVKDVRVLRIDNMAPGDLITLGPDDWKVFPIIRKSGAAGMENSGLHGFAYRVVS